MSGPKRRRLSKEKGKNVHKSGKQSLTFSPTLATLLSKGFSWAQKNGQITWLLDDGLSSHRSQTHPIST